MIGKKLRGKSRNIKNVSSGHFNISSPGLSTGNKLISKGGPNRLKEVLSYDLIRQAVSGSRLD